MPNSEDRPRRSYGRDHGRSGGQGRSREQSGKRGYGRGNDERSKFGRSREDRRDSQRGRKNFDGAGRGGKRQGSVGNRSKGHGNKVAGRTRRDRVPDPQLPDDITGRELSGEVRSQLRPLSKDNAEVVAKQLVATGRLIDSDPEQAYGFAKAAVGRAGRIGVVREALGLVAYELDKYDEAIKELRTHRRITGSDDNLALILDSERGRGLPDKTLELFGEIDRDKLSDSQWIECVMVVAGARADKGDLAAARDLIEAQGFTGHDPSATVRLVSAYSDLLKISGEHELAAKYEELARRTAKANSVAFGDEEIDPNAGIEIHTIEEEPEPERTPEATLEPKPDAGPEPEQAQEDQPAPAAEVADEEQEVEDEVDEILRDAGIELGYDD